MSQARFSLEDGFSVEGGPAFEGEFEFDGGCSLEEGLSLQGGLVSEGFSFEEVSDGFFATGGSDIFDDFSTAVEIY